MGKIRRFLGILTIFATVFLGTNVLAAGYTCPTLKTYTSCSAGYYLADWGTTQEELIESLKYGGVRPHTGNSCIKCLDGWTCNAGIAHPVQNCNKITISSSTANSTVLRNVLYKKTGDNTWYTDETCTTELSGNISATSSSAEFKGIYTTNLIGGTQLFDSDGANTGETWTVTSDKTIYARWIICGTGYHVYNNKCTANTYTVLFHSNDNSTSAATKRQSFTYGVAQELSANTFKRTGYVFQGWATSPTATNEEVEYTDKESVTNLTTANGGTVELYVVWSACTAGYYCPAGSTSVTQNQCPTNWTSAAGAGAQTDCYRTVTLNANGATGATLTWPDGCGNPKTWTPSSSANTITQCCKYNKECPMPSPATLTPASGYKIFDGWYTSETLPDNSSVTLTHKPSITSTAATVTYYAGRRPIRMIGLVNDNGTAPGTVYFVYSDGVYLDTSLTKKMSTTANPITTPAKTGYKFGGYYTSTACSGIQRIDANGYITTDFTNTSYTENAALHACWTSACTKITIDNTTNGGTGGTTEIYKKTDSSYYYSDSDCSTQITSVTKPSKTNARYVGAYTAHTSVGIQCIDSNGALSSSSACMSALDNTAKLYARYDCYDNYQGFGVTIAKACAPSIYIITLMHNDGTDDETKIYERYDTGWYDISDGTQSLKVAPVPARTDYKFRGYYSKQQADLTASGGESIPVIGPSAELPKPTSATRDTTLYAGWAMDCVKPENGICALTINSNGTATYTASCNTGYTVSNANTATPSCNANRYTVTFDPGDGVGTPDPMTVTYGQPMSNPGITPVRTGYVFTGWWYNETLYINADNSSAQDWDIAEDTTLTAGWIKNTETIDACDVGEYLPRGTLKCETCTPGNYCPGTDEDVYEIDSNNDQGIYSCQTVGDGSYTESDAGATSADECYKTEETACYDPCEGERYCKICPNKNFLSCAYDTTAKTTITLYPTGNTEGGDDNTCPVLYNTYTKCSSGMYLTSDVNDCSEKCSSLEGLCPNASGGTETCWSSSINANMSAGASACYGAGCTPTCNLYHDYVLGADDKLTGEYVNHCPEHATCTENLTARNGFRWYPNTICTPTTFCSFTYTCDTGYIARTTGDIEYGYSRTLYGAPNTATTIASCDPGVWKVTLNTNGGSGGTETIYQKYTVGWYSDEGGSNVLSAIETPQRTNYAFKGYFKGDIKVIDENGKPNTDEVALFTNNDGVLTAEWERLQTECSAGFDVNNNTCEAGYYCPGGWVDAGTETDTTLGCMRVCPTDTLNGEVSSTSGSDDITDCYAVRSDTQLSDKTGAGDQTCYYGSDAYNASCNIKITSCVAGRWREAENSQTCALVGIGAYSIEGSIEKMLCANLSGANETTTTSVDNASSPIQCYNTCSNISIENGVRVPKQQYVYYDDSTIPACEYETKCNTGYTALGDVCYPKVLTITLDKGAEDVTQAVDTIYLKYNDGWYLKLTNGTNGQADATDRIESITVPKKQNYSFGGYKALNDEVVINPDGSLSSNYTIFSENATLTAVWGENPIIKCDKGMYYDGFEDACVVCPNGAYCGGVTTHQNGDKIDKGIEYCAALNGTYVEVINQNGRPTEVSISSAKGSDEKADCYATNVQYVSDTNRASGKQTCYYDDATNSYSVNCDNIQVMSCIAGHWLESNKDIDCTEVGYGYYSPAPSLGRVACPNLGDVDGVTTQNTTSEKVTQCYLGDRWFETTNGAQRLSCYHIDDASETDINKGYSYQCAMPVIVACNAGYYDDGKYVDEDGVRDCVPVGANNYSPEQTFFANELEQPLSAKPGSSTLLYQCPDDGKTDTTKAKRAAECYKQNLSCNIVNGKGENTCNYDEAVEAYALNCTNCIVTECDEKYSQVGNTCIGCPADNVCFGGEQKTCSELTNGAYTYADAGTTDVNYCYADCGLAENATQMVGRNYYGANIPDTCQIAKCTSGFYVNDGQCTICPAGSVCDTENQQEDPKTCSELTSGAYTYAEAGTTDVAYCYADCDLGENATQVSGRNYYGDSIEDTCQITACDAGYYLSDGQCIICPEGSVCSTNVPGNKPMSCSELTNGAYTYADAGTTDVNYCYADCGLAENATQMVGRDYYGANIPDTCQTFACDTGYYLSNAQCVICPAGSVCSTDTPDNMPKTCSELTGGLYTLSVPGSSSVDACYKECVEYAVTNGTAVPVEDTVFYPFECEFEGRSPTGNPCDIIDNVCIETSCNYNFELIDGICTPCARENAISYKQGGNCVVESCVSGYHPNGQACESNVIECSAPNAIAATQKWDSNKNAFSECIITDCEDGYHLGSNACQVDEQVCELENGIGVREWNHNTNTWGECIATECNPGYTNDSSLTNEGWKQCGRCNNMYSANGELAASSYVRGCEIASCMYQGELYNLEDNECRLICDTYSDETGSRKWNASRKKCEHTCAPGYTTW
ncbi:MAG: InlB B-repeat-containing protein [Alphaproteobacteria bacterium]|nr:InlB B-repeat-containing protein [Alphaproteobacteria bacterium]